MVQLPYLANSQESHVFASPPAGSIALTLGILSYSEPATSLQPTIVTVTTHVPDLRRPSRSLNEGMSSSDNTKGVVFQSVSKPSSN